MTSIPIYIWTGSIYIILILLIPCYYAELQLFTGRYVNLDYTVIFVVGDWIVTLCPHAMRQQLQHVPGLAR